MEILAVLRHIGGLCLISIFWYGCLLFDIFPHSILNVIVGHKALYDSMSFYNQIFQIPMFERSRRRFTKKR